MSRHLFLFSLLLTVGHPLFAQQFTLPEPPDFLQAPYTVAYEAEPLEPYGRTPFFSNDGKPQPLPDTLPPQVPLSESHREKLDRLKPLRAYLKSIARANPRKKNYNGPDYKLSSGYRIRLRKDRRWQLFSPKLKPKGEPFTRLNPKQSFEDQYLACNRSKCRLFNAQGEEVSWSTAYDLIDFTATGDLTFFKNTLIGVVNARGKEIIPPIAVSIDGRMTDNGLRIYTARQIQYKRKSHFKRLIIIPELDLVTNNIIGRHIIANRYATGATNVIDLNKRTWLYSPNSFKNGTMPTLQLVSETAGILSLTEYSPPEGKYPLSVEDPDKRLHATHLITLSGEYLTSFWSTTGGILYDPKLKRYAVATDFLFGDPEDPVSTEPYAYYNDNYERIRDFTGKGKVTYYGADSVHVFKGESRTLLRDRQGDSLLSFSNAHPILRVADYYFTGRDTIVVSVRHNIKAPPEHPENKSYVFSISRSEIIDTLPYLRQLPNGDFTGDFLHLGANLRPVNDEERLLNTLKEEQGKRPPFPYARSTRIFRTKSYYDYSGKQLIDDFGNKYFGFITSVGERALLLGPTDTANRELDYQVFSVDGHSDLKVSPDYYGGGDLGYDLLRGSLFALHYFPRQKGTVVLIDNGEILSDGNEIQISAYDEKMGLLPFRNWQIPFKGYLTFTGEMLFPAEITEVRQTNNGAFIVRGANGLVGVYDLSGEILPPIYEYVHDFFGDIFECRLPGELMPHYVRHGRVIEHR